MKNVITICTSTAIMCASVSPAAAQERPDLAYFGRQSSVTDRGTAVTAGVRIALGRSRDTRTTDSKLRFDLVAGPSLRLSDGQRLNRTGLINGDGIRFSFAPGHSTRLSLNGRPLVTHYDNAEVAAAEKSEKEGGISTGGWFAIAGGVLLVGVGVAYLAYEDAVDCTENGQSSCE